MKSLKWIAVIGLLVLGIQAAFAFSAATQVANLPTNFNECRDFFPDGKPIARAKDNQVELCYHGMAALYDNRQKRPVFASAYIDPVMLRAREDANRERAHIEFFADPRVPNAPDTRAYTKSGYDRSHLIANSFSTSPAMQAESFSLTANACPMDPFLNREGTWRQMEKATKAYILRSSQGAYLIAGCSGDARLIKNAISVPTAFWMAVYSADKRRAPWGFWIPNVPTSSAPVPITIEELAAKTGLPLQRDGYPKKGE